MSKENLNVNVKIEAINEAVDKIIAFTREMADKQEMKEEKENLKVYKDNWEEEKKLVKAEFKRVSDLLNKSKPGTEEYNNLANSLSKLKSIIGYTWD